MPSIQYEEVDVSEKSLKQRQALFDAAPIEKKMGLWYAKRHYSQLDRERKQGYHHLYLSGPGAIHCTCGLVVKDEGDGAELIEDVADLKLDEIQRVRGHRNLPSGRGVTVALIVGFEWDRSIGDYLWDFFCQECSSFGLKKDSLAAKLFVKEHNRKCGTSLRRRRSIQKKVG